MSDERPVRENLLDRGQAVYVVAVLLGMLAFGTIGFHLTEGWSLGESAYATIITVTSVGYGDLAPVTTQGRVFAVILVSLGLGAVAYVLSSLAALLLWDNARRAFRRKRIQVMIDKLEGHVIICGFGEMGSLAAASMAEQNMPLVVVELDPEHAETAERRGHLAIRGNASDDDVLKRAGIARAAALIASTKSDAENVFIVLTAHQVNPQLQIIARANVESSKSKLLKAGATRIILPYALGAERMVNLVRRPHVADFLEGVLGARSDGLALEEIELRKDSPMAGATVEECGARRDYGVTILAIKPPEGEVHAAPKPHHPIPGGSLMVCFGPRDGLDAFARRL